MHGSGTEPGDFIDLDLDMIEADRQQRIRLALESTRTRLEAEIMRELRLTNDGNELVLADNEGVRYRATFAPDGRLIVTDERPTELL